MKRACLSSASNIVANLKNQKLWAGIRPSTFNMALSIIRISPIAIFEREFMQERYSSAYGGSSETIIIVIPRGFPGMVS